MIETLFFFGICIFGFGDCEDTPTFQEEMNQLIELAYECGQVNGTTNWTKKGEFGGILRCNLKLEEQKDNKIIPIITKSYDMLTDSTIIDYHGNNCYYTKSSENIWEISYCTDEQYDTKVEP